MIQLASHSRILSAVVVSAGNMPNFTGDPQVCCLAQRNPLARDFRAPCRWRCGGMCQTIRDVGRGAGSCPNAAIGHASARPPSAAAFRLSAQNATVSHPFFRRNRDDSRFNNIVVLASTASRSWIVWNPTEQRHVLLRSSSVRTPSGVEAPDVAGAHEGFKVS